MTAFDGVKRLASGALAEVAIAVKKRIEAGASGPVLVYDDATGRVIDVDIRGSEAEMVARLEDSPAAPGGARPRADVEAREVTLLPRHWDWLDSQPGGALVALRKLVDQARRTSGARDRQREAQDTAYRFLSSIAGHFPGYEEALRALFAYDRRRFAESMASWPPDIRDHAVGLAFADLNPDAS